MIGGYLDCGGLVAIEHATGIGEYKPLENYDKCNWVDGLSAGDGNNGKLVGGLEHEFYFSTWRSRIFRRGRSSTNQIITFFPVISPSFSIIYGMSSFPLTLIVFKMVIAPPTSYFWENNKGSRVWMVKGKSLPPWHFGWEASLANGDLRMVTMALYPIADRSNSNRNIDDLKSSRPNMTKHINLLRKAHIEGKVTIKSWGLGFNMDPEMLWLKHNWDVKYSPSCCCLGDYLSDWPGIPTFKPAS